MKTENKTDKYYADWFKVTPMTIGRWRRGITEPDYRTKRFAALLLKAKAIDHIPSWLELNEDAKQKA
jgi:hypothetical protein